MQELLEEVLQGVQVMPSTADAVINSQFVASRADGEGDHPSSSEIGLNGYWRKADGDIVLLDGGPNGFATYVKKKWIFLAEYGLYSLSPTRNWNPMTDPYRRILERGGIREFTRQQICELNWHRKPHPVLQAQIDTLVRSGVDERKALDVVIPQLAGYEWETYLCEAPSCRGRTFNTKGELQAHEVLHREDVRTRQLGESIAQAVSAGQTASAETLAPAIKMIAEVVDNLARSQADMQANFTALLAEIANQKKSSK